MDMYEIIKEQPVLAILRNVPSSRLPDYAQAVSQGGIRLFEVALNSEDALKQITALRNKFGDAAFIGAGTAVTEELAKAALDAGAQFLLAPSAPEEVLAYCQRNQVKFLPGVFSPTDVGLCLRYGFRTLKLFPAGDLPRGYVKSLKGPFSETEYVAIGGVNRDNIRGFFDAGCIGAGLASNLLPGDAVASGDWERCARSVRELLAAL